MNARRQKLLEKQKVWNRIQAGTASELDHRLANAWGTEHYQRSLQESPKFEIWLMNHGDSCLTCWANGIFQPDSSPFPHEALLFLAACYCKSDIDNGGFDQFLRNCTGDLAPEGIKGLLAIGLSESAKILEDIVSLFGSKYPRDQETRVAIMPSDATLEHATMVFYQSYEDVFEEKASEYFEQMNGFIQHES